MIDLLTSLGRFHILVLHLPIGMLALVALMEFQMWRKGSLAWGDQIKFCLRWSAYLGGVSAVLGWLLYFSDNYSGNLILLHQWFGTATSVVLFLQWRLYPRSKMVMLFLAGTLMALTGHFGGSVTHGEDFLTAGFTSESSSTDLESARIYEDLVSPILVGNCTSCHSAGKQKGGLALSDSMGIARGGEGGPVILAGDFESSPFLQAIEAPIHAEIHMPPEGRQQLTASEVRFLKWWVELGIPHHGLVSDFPADAEIKALLDKQFASPHPLADEGIGHASAETLADLESQGFRISAISPGDPYLRLNLSDRTDLDEATFEAMASIQDQVTFMDFGDSNIEDELMRSVADFPHVQTLRLDQTKVTEKGLAALSGLEFLETLDLSRTSLTEDVLPLLEGFPALKNLNLWETQLGDRLLAQQDSMHPEWQLEYGQASQNFSEAILLMPEVLPNVQLFRDPIRISLKSSSPGTSIHYSLDGSTPDEKSNLFEDSILIGSTVTLQARCYKEGWEPSAALERLFFYLPHPTPKALNYKQADERYPGKGAKSLFDLELGPRDFKSPEWTGYYGEDFAATFVLDKQRMLQQVSIHCLEDVGSWIFPPKEIRVLGGLSKDHMTALAKFNPVPPNAARNTRASFFTLDFEPQEFRFLRLEIDNFGTLPDWHDSPGSPAWLFVDEVIIP